MNRPLAVIMAGGSGSRLFPTTFAVSKHLLPVFDKPMIYYPISLAMFSGIREILIVCREKDIEEFEAVLSHLKFLQISYVTQNEPRGIADGLNLIAPLAKDRSILFILGDNVLFGPQIKAILKSVVEKDRNTVFGYRVDTPEEYGVAELCSKGSIRSIIEKPQNPQSNIALIGVYYYTSKIFEKITNLQPSSRGELEISDLNSILVKDKNLSLEKISGTNTWIDCGTPDRLLQASLAVKNNLKTEFCEIGYLEKIALSNGWLTAEDFARLPKHFFDSNYGQSIEKLVFDNLGSE